MQLKSKGKEILLQKERTKILQSIGTLIRKNKTFFLSGHQKPDGDTVASELAMASLLSRLHKSVEIYNYDPVPDNLLFLPGCEKIKTAKKVDKRYDVGIIFECNDAQRTGNIIDFDRQLDHIINVDHHIKNSLFGDINLVDSKFSSNSEQLCDLFDAMNLPINSDEATCLYVGIMMDTGKFQYSNTNSETLRVASKLLEHGLDVSFLCEKVYGARTLSSLKLLSSALSKLQLVSDGKIACVETLRDDFKKTNSNESETEEIVNYGLQISTVLISIYLRESLGDGLIKVSLRSKKHVNVFKLAKQFGGGGHKCASGFKVSDKIENVRENIISAAQKLISKTS